ncbi:UNVERIFIED_CONTAM: Nucleoside diphosphate kinase, chloroplastic [Sesamum radiatum]|uniref:Nucleoside diphosphate kinase, chloroplastic n=1 Tax=Sesamum radiatum TaxID=300843 RepID=A0AAW2PJ07_SESRA
MDAVAVLGGATTISYASSSPAKDGRLSHTPTRSLNLHTSHLAAFRPCSSLFTYSPSRPYASKNLQKAHIFLPHLVASMVFKFNFFSWFFKNSFPVVRLLPSLCLLFVQEDVEESYIMIKPDGVQRGLVRFHLLINNVIELVVKLSCGLRYNFKV